MTQGAASMLAALMEEKFTISSMQHQDSEVHMLRYFSWLGSNETPIKDTLISEEGQTFQQRK